VNVIAQPVEPFLGSLKGDDREVENIRLGRYEGVEIGLNKGRDDGAKICARREVCTNG
jgi:hypothetical protein